MTQPTKPEKTFDPSRMSWDKMEVLGNETAVGIMQGGKGAFESGFSVGQPFWHNLGTQLKTHPKDPQEALKIGGANWEVIQAPLEVPAFTLPDGTPVARRPYKRKVVNVRGDTGAILGDVGPDYTPLQNWEAFAVAENLLYHEKLLAESLVVLGGGRRVILLCRLPKTIMIGNDPDEAVDPFLALSNEHTGGQAFTIYTTDWRIACENSARMSLQDAPNVWKGKHTKGLPFRIEEMQDILKLSLNYYDLYEKTANRMLDNQMSPAAAKSFLSHLVPLPEPEPGKDNERARLNKLAIRELIAQIHNGTAPKVGAFDPESGANIRNTEWGWYNAVTAYSNHYRLPRGWKSDKPERVLKAQEARLERMLAQDSIIARADKLLVPTAV